MMRSTLLMISILAGCGGAGESATQREQAGATDPQDGANTEVDLSRLVYVDVHPANLLDADLNFRVLPETVGPFSPEIGLNVGAIQLEMPTFIDGRVTADVVTPQAAGADLPFEFGPIAAKIIVTHNARSVQNYTAITDENGSYDTLLVADGYDIFVIPDNPMIPVVSHHEAIDSSGTTIDFEIGQGVAIWGQVRYPSDPSTDPFRVHVIDGNGIRSATSLTDEDGYYLIRVLPDEGPFTVVCEGRDAGRDPVLTSEPIDPAADTTYDTGFIDEFVGVQIDFDYPTYRLAAARGRVLDDDDNPIEDVEVRFTSKQITGYDGRNEALQITRITGKDGNFDVSLLAGEYTVEFMPEGAKSPRQSQASVAGGDNNLGSVFLDALTVVSGIVRDVGGEAIPLAEVSCAEIGFGQRVWSTYADESGSYTLDLPRTDIECTMTPPNTRSHALTRQQLDGASFTADLDLVVSGGTLARGTVDLAGAPEAFAVIEFRDGLGRLLGSTVTDEEGSFRMQIDLPPVEEEATTP